MMNRPEISCSNPKAGSRKGARFPQTPGALLRFTRRREYLLLLAGLGCVGGAWAAPPGDPTEPPAVWLAAQPPVPGVPEVTVKAVPRTQVVVTSKSRKLAVIDGEVVKVGDQFNDSKVVAIKADKVVMDDASKSLRTTPDVEKKKAVVSKVRKKSVMIPEASVSSKAQ